MSRKAAAYLASSNNRGDLAKLIDQFPPDPEHSVLGEFARLARRGQMETLVFTDGDDACLWSGKCPAWAAPAPLA
jgi:hypothetical protein